MARGRGGGGSSRGGRDKSNKLRRRKFSKNLFKNQSKRFKKSSKDDDHSSIKTYNKKRGGARGRGNSNGTRGGPAAGRGPQRSPPPVPEHESESESGEEEEANPLEQLMSTLGGTNTNMIDSDQEEESDESMENSDESMDDASVSGEDAGADLSDDDGDVTTEQGTDAPIEHGNDTDSDESSASEADETPDVRTISPESSKKLLDDSVDDDGDDDGVEESDDADDSEDPYPQHFGSMLEADVVERIGSPDSWSLTQHKWSSMGSVSWRRLVSNAATSPPSAATAKDTTLTKLAVQPKLHPGWHKSNASRAFGGETFSPLQRELFSVANTYSDLLFYGRTHENSESVRSIYCLHALNHVLKTRLNVRRHNLQLERCDEVPDECRDQGFTRPKVLILVPFRESALRVVHLLMSILSPDERADVLNKRRFQEEYGGDEVREPKVGAVPKPPDHLATFAGNVDDNFSIGVGVANKALRLYADFYSADIIISSPLALRVIIKTEGEKGRDYDFLSSIELLIIDQADVMLMQNWGHFLHIMEHLHKQPQDSHGVDFSRVRPWVLEGWGRHYRQTMLFTSFVCPEVNGFFSKHCCNYEGLVRTCNTEKGGAIQQVAVQIPHVFQRFQSDSPKEDPEARFRYFVKTVLPQYTESVMSRTMVFVPSYFDFVSLRNYMRKMDLYHIQISEYHDRGKVAQAREMLCRKRVRFALYTERAHFYNRYAIKDITHLIFYQLPSFPHFYSELCNLIKLRSARRAAEKRDHTCTVIFSRYDAHRLAATVGSDRAAQMLSSETGIHLLVTGDASK